MNMLRTDEQTILDLGIFGKQKGDGIYDIYNQVHTRGGEAMLEQLFLNPLADKDSINKRSSIIAGFASSNLSFPYNVALFDMVEKYLANSEENEKNRNNRATLSENEIQNGVSAVIELIQGTKSFIEERSLFQMRAYESDREAIVFLLTQKVFEPVLKDHSKEKLSYGAITAFDALFRVSERDKIEKLLRHIYFLDVYMSVAQVALERKFVFPRALDRSLCLLKIEQVYHPALETPVGNDVIMSTSKNVMFLTGANMAGKSTFLRSLSSALYIAHIGFPVAAKSMEFSVMDGLYTTINLPDNLGIGASHFYAEVLRVKKIATELSSGKSFFILFDELFRGTNVKDAHEATVAVIEGFARMQNSMFIISSHIVEAGADLQQKSNINFVYLPTRMKNHVPEYSYTLEKGITNDRHGMIIIRNEGILDILANGKKYAH